MEKKLVQLMVVIAIALLVVAGVCYALLMQQSGPGKLDGFAQCLKNKGVLMYGAFWCPHCQDEKSLFGSSKQYLPYVECSTADSNGQLQVCKDAKINVYPTWKFPDGSTQEGEMMLQELATKSGCVLPQ